MDNQLKSLYSKIKERKISDDDALEQMKEFKTLTSQGITPATVLGNEYHIATDKPLPNPDNLETAFNVDLNDLSAKIQKYLLNKLNKIVTNHSRLANLEVNLMDLGLESSQLVNFCHEIENETGIELTPTIFFEYPNVKELAQFFAQEHYEAFAKVLGTVTQFEDMQKEAAISPKEASLQKAASVTQQGRAAKQLHTSSSACAATQPVKDDIAIIGMHGLFAEANDLNQFWNNLLSKKDVMKEIPLDHWDYRPWYDENRGTKDKTYCKWGSFIDDVDKFDAAFFNISPREAEWMDPQIRLLLQSIYATGEDAGYINKLRGTNTGVFVGVCFHDYADKIAELNLPVDPYLATGNSQTVLANRISFLMNLMGPSQAIDTACSSSLVALHYACRAIHNKECGMAFVGGANLLLSSAHYRNFCSIGALSPTGRCHTFDAAADGYAPGECVASILLKSLSQAKRDGDHIYAVIKGTAALHGGYTPSLTAPSVAGEENVILRAWEDAGIDPETISYIEAHGTGTKLGDPIEIDSLKKAFKRFTNKEHFCAIGSAKANIGHAEGAAGIAGLLKVILQMKNKQIPCLPKFNKLNPYIQLDKSALYINQDIEEWKSPEGAPRRAGISSFGFSGAYAHAVIEEYIAEDLEEPKYAITPKRPVIIVLSAKRQERLREQVEQLLNSIQEQQFTDSDLGNIAYTLQVSRETMEERLGLIVSSIKELEEKLRGFLDGRDGIIDLYRGQLKNNQENLADYSTDEDLEKTIDAWIAKGKYAKLLDLWVKGLSFDWRKLYGKIKPRRISLPTYPFAQESYWVPTDQLKSTDNPTVLSAISVIHPLLQKNTSDFYEQRFTSTFTGNEVFLADYFVKGQRLLPGAAYLEIARAAVVSATGVGTSSVLNEVPFGLRLKNVTWNQPIFIGDQSVQVHIGLSPDTEEEIAFKIYSDSEIDDTEPIIHSQGRVILTPFNEAPTLNLDALRDQCNQCVLLSEQYYEAFRKIDIVYGPEQQGIEVLYVGTNQVLAKLSLPSTVFNTQNQFFLHPFLIDSALQASLGLKMYSDVFKPTLPLNLQELEIFSKCTPSMWAFIRYSNGSGIEDSMQKFDIDLSNEQGNVCVQLKGLSLRTLEGEIHPGKLLQGNVEIFSDSLVGSIMLTPVWDAILVEKVQSFPLPTEQFVIIGGSIENQRAISQYYPNATILEIQDTDTVENIEKKLEVHFPINHILWIAPYHPIKELTDESLITEQSRGVLQVFRLVKALLHLGYGNMNLGWSFITTQTQPIHKNDVVNPTHASLHGFIGSLAKEYSNWKIRLVDLEANGEWPITDIFNLPPDLQGDPLVYRSGEWYRQALIPLQNPLPVRKLYRTGGVYVMIGGAGTIGEVWSEYMIRTYQAQIIWIGRRQKDSEIQAKLERLATLGPTPHYITADATNRESLLQAYQEIKEKYLQIHGVIHSAMVFSGGGLAKIEEELFKSVLSIKVDVSVRIAQVFQNENLDFIMFFSSIYSFLKTHGQSNYSAGCVFKDAFAHQLALEWPCAVKVMNWGYWGNVSVAANPEAFRTWMEQEGIGLVDPLEAMEALEKLLAGVVDQIAFAKATKPSGFKGMVPAKELLIFCPEQLSLIGGFKTESTKPTSSIEGPPKEMEELLYKLLLGQLQAIELFKGKNASLEDLKAKIKLRDLYSRWLEESIAVLTRKDCIKYDGNSYIVSNITSIDLNEVWGEWDLKKKAWLEIPGLKAQVVLVEATLRALPEILTGERTATDIIFPNSSMELVEGIYKNNKIADYFNEVLADILVAYIQKRFIQDSAHDNVHEKIRIIEIGAGTGGTSTMVFRKLASYREHIQEYCYTDISKAFLMHAEKEYGFENPYLTYKIFNVEAPVDGQGIDTGEYDIAIATNVLHATKNIRQTLRNAKATLKKNGLILLNELSRNSLFLHLTFGLLEGWWLYEDTALRIPGCPALYPETWQKVLEKEGFTLVSFPAQEAHGLGQQIIVAESDGVVRQKRLDIYTNKQKVKIKEEKVKKVASTVNKKTLQPKIVHDKHSSIPKINYLPNNFEVTDLILENHVKEVIKEKLSESLKMDINLIDFDEPFADYGVDSITGVHLVQIINQALLIELGTTIIFDYSSVNRLTKYILSKYKDIVTKSLGQNKEQISILNNLTPISQEEHPVYSYAKDYQKRRMLTKSDIKENNTESPNSKDPIAIIGMSGRYAKSKSLKELWANLANGKDLIEEVTRWDIAKYYPKHMSYCKHGSFLDDIDQFDPLFFNISGLEATYMDPQQRVFLEESWKALEDAGYGGTGIGGRLCGVYVGCNAGDYQTLLDNNYPAQAFWGNLGAIIPARIAYYLDLHGPAISVDSACSSSLVAIYLACQSLWTKEIEMAIAGGIQLHITPMLYLLANNAGMLSPTGHCYTFDDRADGFVPGEGVGVIVLKRLKEAISDGDHIYGVIRGIGINQDGTTNGITAPSANSQERLERYVYDTFNINPEQIGMVEAHGTGTILGDPIEFNALTQAFKAYTDKKHYCAIGSIKTNLGHTLLAAGVTGVIKILLSLQHKQIPPSLHYQVGNSNIKFEESPFYVNTSLQNWDIESDSKRLAVLSSFGASGTNAHMAIEEAPNLKRNHSEKLGYLIVLSARTADQLRRQVEQIVEFCEQEPHVDCGNMSYTLLLGRKHFNHRLACIIHNLQELETLFKKWLEKGKLLQVYVSELNEKEHREQVSLKRYGNECIKNCQSINRSNEYMETLATIADLYIQGYELDFEQLFSNEQYSRISLPTYPFARERYWVPKVNIQSKSSNSIETLSITSFIHPLLHRNTSNLSKQRFSSTYTGEEFFLTDHVVKGQRVLPGVAYLEIARVAVEKAIEDLSEGGIGIRLKNVIWVQPIVIGNEPVQVHIGLFPEENGEIAYEIYGSYGDGGAEVKIHSQGSAVLNSCINTATLDLAALKVQCNQNIISSSQCYEVFKEIGLDYGAGFRGIKNVYVGSKQVLAELSLPSSVFYTKDQFFLHPSMMDSALQASLMIDSNNWNINNTPRKPALPFALHELEILGNCTSQMWAVIRCNADSTDALQKLDIDLCDDHGTICVRMKGFSSRVLEGEVGANIPNLSSSPILGTLLLEPIWKEQVVTEEVPVLDYDQYLTIFCEPDVTLLKNINTQMKGIARTYLYLTLQSSHGNIAERFQIYAEQIFEEIQRILNEKPQKNILIQIVVSTQPEQQLFTSLFGLLKTAHLENPKLIGQLIEIEPGENSTEYIEKLKENARAISSDVQNQIRYEGGKRWVADWSEVVCPKEEELIIPWKDRGVYLITGGAGGLGLIFAKEISQRAKDITLILTGRSELNEDKKAKLEELRTLGSRVEYKQVDVTQNKEVMKLIQGIKENYGSLHGIIHSAGIIRDNYIIKKTKEELKEVLQPKVSGLVNLDLASQDLELDFFILFSSIAGSLGNPGQADYATANSFMDAYANYRNILVTLKHRHGHTMSINWPLWREGGMQVDEETEKMMMQNIGMYPMPTNTGIQALYQSLVSVYEQVMVIEGDIELIKQKLLPQTNSALLQPLSLSTTTDTDILSEKVQAVLIQTVSQLLKVKSDDIDAMSEFNEYGLDQFKLTEFVNKLNQEFNLELTTTIFNEHSTLESFTRYLVSKHQDRFAKRFGKTVSESTSLTKKVKEIPIESISTIEKNKETLMFSEDLLREKAINYLKKLLSTVIKLPTDRIEANAPMEKYGIDSIMVMQLTNQLEKTFGSLPKTLFFEYQNIQDLVGYFLTSYRNQLTDILGIQEKETAITTENLKGPDTATEPVKSMNIGMRPRFKPVRIESLEEKVTGTLDIAIIGVSGRYPGAKNIQEFWKNLRDGKDCITEIPKDRWNHSLYFDEDKNNPGKTYSKWGGFLDDVDKFDPLFFNISPREAEMIDPQERLFLECVYETLEDAGYTREALRTYQGSGLEGNVGVFVGVMYEEYQLFGAQEQIQGRPVAISGNPASIANRVSYFCNFHGPSMAIDTMCSSSLTAIHLACQNLQHGSCELAIAGGVNVSIHPNKYLVLGQGKFVSSKGRCESFGEGGDGYVPGEGVGAVLLKPLSKAIADGDHIYGIIKGTAVNHGGKTNGYTVPNPNAQAGVIGQAFKVAGINPRTVSYIEAHGTGTSLGDPIEIAGLNKSFQEYTKDKQFCAIGSAKSNIGHCESAAGIAGVTKVLLQLEKRQLVPSLHSQILNPNIDFSNTPFTVQQELTEWKRPMVEIDGNIREYPRIAGISAFGAGGSNAHVVIEEYIAKVQEHSPITNTPQKRVVIVLSAKNEERLKEQTQRLLVTIYEQKFSSVNLADIAFTLQVGREAMEERLGLIVSCIEELEEKLNGFIDDRNGIEDLYRGQVKSNQETIAVLTADEDLQKAIDIWISKGKYSKLLDLWVKGLIFDWNKLYGEIKPRRISLPTYPFARKRYWVPVVESKSIAYLSTPAIDVSIQPKIHQNIFEQKRVQSSVSQHSLHPITLIGQISSSHSNKPSGITLCSLSEEQIQSSKSMDQIRPFIQLSSTKIALAQPQIAEESLLVNNVQTGISAKLLQEDLKKSLAQALFMELSEIDIDKKFIDMGLDSIIGVEWIRLINTQYGMSIPATRIYDYPSLREFAEFLEKQLNKNSNQVKRSLEISDPIQTATNISKQPIVLSQIEPASISISEPNSAQTQVVRLQNNITAVSLLEELRTSLAKALYMERSEVDVDKKFIDMGLDSIIGVEWIGMINKYYSTSIPATRVYDYPCLREFSGFLEKELNKNGNQTICSPKISDHIQPLSKGPMQPVVLSQIQSSPFSRDLIIQPISIRAQSGQLQTNISVELLQEELRTSLANALYMEWNEVDIDKKFIDMGLDSIIGVEWIEALNKQYGLSIPATKVYDYPSIREFAEFLTYELHKKGGILIQSPSKPTSSLSLDEVLQQVSQGNLSIEQADQIIQQFYIKEEQNE